MYRIFQTIDPYGDQCIELIALETFQEIHDYLASNGHLISDLTTIKVLKDAGEITSKVTWTLDEIV